MLGSHYLSKENGYAMTQCILESSVSHLLMKTYRIRLVLLSSGILWRSLVFPQCLRVYNLTPEILVELLGGN